MLIRISTSERMNCLIWISNKFLHILLTTKWRQIFLEYDWVSIKQIQVINEKFSKYLKLPSFCTLFCEWLESYLLWFPVCFNFISIYYCAKVRLVYYLYFCLNLFIFETRVNLLRRLHFIDNNKQWTRHQTQWDKNLLKN